MEDVNFPKAFLWGVNSPFFPLLENSREETKQRIFENAEKDLSEQLSFLKSLKINSFRFNLNWDLLYLDPFYSCTMYDNFIEQLRQREIEPIVNLIDFDVLSYNQKEIIDTIENEENISKFIEIIEKIVSSFKYKVQYYIILNHTTKYLKRRFFKGTDVDKTELNETVQNLLNFYDKSVRIIKSINPYAKVSVSEEFNVEEEEQLDFVFSFIDIVVKGKSPFFENMAFKKSEIDFIGIDFNDLTSNSEEYTSLIKELSKEKNNIDLDEVIKRFSYKYYLPFLITENISTVEDDSLKSRYLVNNLYKINQSLESNVKIFGYIYNSLSDIKINNRLLKTGLYRIDDKNNYISLRNFAKVYSNIIEDNSINERYLKYID
ncbi:glycoside hydrolase family 1 [Petrotoga mobilis SJ95]|uniref:Glycoside hydrolase family 1 n=1 Tax=Petrotoga mobilis (strain DSM 10674 / SJ95) TaxID=403833 RepID=A9BHC7_PETMO|nr:family 1 glycosylhydrolase [Petrotoga mobilis]ABX31536.1 glycoside hydrolase family 1 [Petrotoga mobilis SJ95]